MSVYLKSTASLRLIEVTIVVFPQPFHLQVAPMSHHAAHVVNSAAASTAYASSACRHQQASFPASHEPPSPGAPGCRCVSCSNTERPQWSVKKMRASSFNADDLPHAYKTKVVFFRKELRLPNCCLFLWLRLRQRTLMVLPS